MPKSGRSKAVITKTNNIVVKLQGHPASRKNIGYKENKNKHFQTFVLVSVNMISVLHSQNKHK